MLWKVVTLLVSAVVVNDIKLSVNKKTLHHLIKPDNEFNFVM